MGTIAVISTRNTSRDVFSVDIDGVAATVTPHTEWEDTFTLSHPTRGNLTFCTLCGNRDSDVIAAIRERLTRA